MTDTLIERLLRTAPKRDEAGWQEIAFEAAERISALSGENERLREIASSADRAMRFVRLVASQRPSEQACEWYAGEFGDEGEPDFEGAYDSFIQGARNILNDDARAALNDKGSAE